MALITEDKDTLVKGQDEIDEYEVYTTTIDPDEVLDRFAEAGTLRELETVQTKQKLNRVFSTDEEGPGGAHHNYIIVPAEPLEEHYKETGIDDNDGEPILASNSCLPYGIYFQRGPRKENDSLHGILDTDLLEIVRDRLKSFQKGPYASDYNARALMHVELALEALNARVEDRTKRGVLGKNEK